MIHTAFNQNFVGLYMLKEFNCASNVAKRQHPVLPLYIHLIHTHR